MLLESFSRQSTFLINVPVIALAIVGVFVLVPPSKATHAPRIDYVGGLLSVVWIAALVFTLIEAPHGWDAKAVTGTVIGVAGLVAFGLWELHHPHPLLDLRRFANRAFTGATSPPYCSCSRSSAPFSTSPSTSSSSCNTTRWRPAYACCRSPARSSPAPC